MLFRRYEAQVGQMLHDLEGAMERSETFLEENPDEV